MYIYWHLNCLLCHLNLDFYSYVYVFSAVRIWRTAVWWLHLSVYPDQLLTMWVICAFFIKDTLPSYTSAEAKSQLPESVRVSCRWDYLTSMLSNWYAGHPRVYIEVNNGSCCLEIILYRRAFDSVSHYYLLDKLQAFGIVGKARKWFEAYLQNCYQRICIKIGDSFSELCYVHSRECPRTSTGCGLQQWPTWLLSIRNSTKFLQVIRSSEDTVRLQSDINSASDWSYFNWLVIQWIQIYSFTFLFSYGINRLSNIYHQRQFY